MADFSPATFEFLVVILGAITGSFLNVCIHRIPERRSIVWPGSSCPACGHSLAWWENIPILSYVLLKGRCSSCKGRISPRYPAVELLCAILALGLWLRFGPGGDFLAFYFFSSCLVVVTFIDLRLRIIPDVITLPGIAAGLLASCFLTDVGFMASAAGTILGGGILYLVAWGYWSITGREGMGGGDIKLLAMIGAFLGWRAVPLVITASAGIGAVTGLAMMIILRGERHSAIPFGPFLSAASILAIFYGDQILAWYSSLVLGT